MVVDSAHTRFLELLIASDKEVKSMSLDELKQAIYHASTFKEDGLWNQELMDYICSTELSQFATLGWIAEKYYAAELRNRDNAKYFEHFYLVGYARLTSLRMEYNTNLGHSADDSAFVGMLLKKNYKASPEHVSILEVGCGTGELLIDIASLGYRQVSGMDISPSAIRLARQRFLDHHLKAENLYCMSLDDFYQAFPQSQFDVVVHSDVIEHIPPDLVDQFLETIFNLLKPGGFMAVMTPSKLTGPHDRTRFYTPHGTGPQGLHMQEFLLSQLERLLYSVGFTQLMTVSSLPSLNEFWDTISEDNFRFKIELEKFLPYVDWKFKKPLVDGMYFKGAACQKPK